MAERRAKKVEWVKKDAFVMPVLPKSLKVDPATAALFHLSAFLELSGDDTLDPDWAIEAMEHVGHYLQQLPVGGVESLRRQAARVAAHARKNKWGAPAVRFFTNFVENFGLGGDADD